MLTTNDTIEKTHGTVSRERIMTDLEALVRDAEDLLKATAGDASEKAKEARVRLGGALERAKSAWQEVHDQSATTAKAAAGKVDSVIRDHPYESLGVAFGVGLLIGFLVRKK